MDPINFILGFIIIDVLWAIISNYNLLFMFPQIYKENKIISKVKINFSYQMKFKEYSVFAKNYIEYMHNIFKNKHKDNKKFTFWLINFRISFSILVLFMIYLFILFLIQTYL